MKVYFIAGKSQGADKNRKCFYGPDPDHEGKSLIAHHNFGSITDLLRHIFVCHDCSLVMIAWRWDTQFINKILTEDLQEKD